MDALRYHLHWLENARSIVLWNAGFQAPAVAFCFYCGLVNPKPSPRLYIPAALLGFWRINELVYAFYRDAMDRIEGYRSSDKFSPGQRIRLLMWAYSEIVLQFGIIHFAIDIHSKWSAYTGITKVLDAIYFSGVTITTTGFGDIQPCSSAARLAALFESITGVLFIGLSLAVYLATKPTHRKAKAA